MPRPRALLVALVAALGAAAPPAGSGAAPTDIVRVDEFIGAPREAFGRSAAGIERALGPPGAVERAAVASYRDPTVFQPTRRLSYPGIVIDVLEGGAVRRIRVLRPGLGWPFGLDVGSTREDVERTLGEPQEAGDTHLMYLYSDGYPDTVHFHLRDGRVHGLEWNYGSAE